ncbi:MAG: hypothetical protein HKN91_14390 [Acidimicrobiia bacterium]|nr:hypothetical protein [Acidimicrobiia bacterium]
MRKMWPVLAALVVLTSACRLETNVIIDVNDDGSGVITTELGLDQEMQDLLESFGGGEDLLSGLDLGDGTPTETRTEGDMTFFGATQSFSDPSEVQALLDQNQDQASFEDFQLSVDDNGAVLIARTGPLGEQDGLDPGSLPFDPSTITDDVFAANIFVNMPGNVTEHNADEVLADGTLRWGISLTDPLDISAESSFGGDGLPWLPIGIAAVAILGVGAFLVMRNRDDTATGALATAEVPPAPMDFADPATRATEQPGTAAGELPPELPPQDGV